MDVATAAALASGSKVAVTGFVLLVSGQSPVLCSELLESMPPQCGGARMELVGLDGPDLPGRQGSPSRGRWSVDTFDLSPFGSCDDRDMRPYARSFNSKVSTFLIGFSEP